MACTSPRLSKPALSRTRITFRGSLPGAKPTFMVLEQVPHKQYHAAAKRGSTAYPGEAAMRTASDWATALSVCVSLRLHLPAAAAALLSDLVQLLFYHSRPPIAEQLGDDSLANAAEAIAGRLLRPSPTVA